jgi:hypothetical protein
MHTIAAAVGIRDHNDPNKSDVPADWRTVPE